MSTELALVAEPAPVPVPVPADITATRAQLLAVDVAQASADLVAAWLLAQDSPNTTRAYGREALRWLTWCHTHALDPWQTVRRPHADAYARSLTGAPTSRARALAALSSLYAYAAEHDVVTDNPWRHVKRPKISADDSTTPGLTAEETRRLIAAAADDSPRSEALVTVLATMALRVGELLGADVTDIGYDRGHTVLRVTRKGGKRQAVPMPPATLDAVRRYLAGRQDGPLITTARATSTTAAGNRVREEYVHRLLRRLARTAGLPQASTIRPHSLRHSAATAALDAGASLADVQDWMGHADPRTTRRYDRARNRLDRSPVYAVAAAVVPSAEADQ